MRVEPIAAWGFCATDRPLHFSSQDLTVSVANGKKVLLDKVSGQISLGFYAIMG